jgi:hypothetical protein
LQSATGWTAWEPSTTSRQTLGPSQPYIQGPPAFFPGS